MLIEFSVENYRSFQHRVTLSMEAAKLKHRNTDVDETNVFAAGYKDRYSLLTSAAVYGANASGKSNLVQAMRFMREFVRNSARESQIDDPIGVKPFLLNQRTQKEPAQFELVFLHENVQYRYGFAATRTQVTAEWLYERAKSRESRLYERTHIAGEEYDVYLNERLRRYRRYLEQVRPNALILSEFARSNVAFAKDITRWFTEQFRFLSGLNDAGHRGFSLHCLEEDNDYREQVTTLIKYLDLSIGDMRLEKSPLPPEFHEIAERMENVSGEPLPEGFLDTAKIIEVKTAHTVFDDEGNEVGTEWLDMDEHESDGTQKLFALAGPIIDVLMTGKVLVVDEFDARLHPLMARAIIEVFNSPRSNPHHAQLIITTHDSTMLSRLLFRRDQIWFTEKNPNGASDLYSLVDLGGVRNDERFDSEYLYGSYGAVPQLDSTVSSVMEYLHATQAETTQ